MNISFENVDNLWVAEFEVKGDFNIHLERDAEGRLNIYQRTAGEKYELMYGRTVYDCDFTSLVYPKAIKIVSSVNPMLAVVTAASGNDEDITVSNGIIEYHFEIPMEGIEPSGRFDDMWLENEVSGDYTDIYNKIYKVYSENADEYGSWLEGVTEKTNLTVNGYRVTSFEPMWDDKLYMLFSDGPSHANGVMVFFLTPNKMRVEIPYIG